MNFFRHITALTGVGVGGGSLVYANTLPVPKEEFYTTGNWAGVADWQTELAPHFETASKMLGAVPNPEMTYSDDVMAEIAKDLGREEYFHPTKVAVFFGEPDVPVPDPYFGGDGPDRVGCTKCGGCMTGCRVGAKNTLDLNYLYLAQQLGAEVIAETEVTAIRHREGRYVVETKSSLGWFKEKKSFSADRVVLSGGVVGTIPLLLRMRLDPDGLPRLSDKVGRYVRTNNEAIMGVTTSRRDVDISEGISISSILHTDAHSHVEPVRYASGSGFFRALVLPRRGGSGLLQRLVAALVYTLSNPLLALKALFVPDWAKYTLILLYMRSLDGTMSFVWSRLGMRSALCDSKAPTANMPEANDIATRVSEKMHGFSVALGLETLFDIPTTAHILGGACVAKSEEEGVINGRHEVFGYPGLYVCDGSAISANPGVNPALSICAMTERAMTFIEPKS